MDFDEFLASLHHCVVKGCTSRNDSCRGKPHNCRKCGAKNKHRTQDCEKARILGTQAMSLIEFFEVMQLYEKYQQGRVNAPYKGSSSVSYAKKAANALVNNPVKFDIAGAYVVKRDSNGDLYLLLQKRSYSLGGKLTTPGGEANRGETAEQTARRELDEESGLKNELAFIQYFGAETLGSGKSLVPCLFEYTGQWKFGEQHRSSECAAFEDLCFKSVIYTSFGHAWVKLTELPYGFGHANSEKFCGKIPIKTIANIRKYYGL